VRDTRVGIALALCATLACTPAPDGVRATDAPQPPATTKPVPPAEPASAGPVTRCDLAQGSEAHVAMPFVAVIRDEAAYRTLIATIHAEIPPLEPGFLPSGIVVGAFLGTKPTPGYKAAIRRDENAFRIEEERPPAGAILAQVITTPFAMAGFPEAPDAPVILDPGATIDASLMPFAVGSGTLTVSGGIAGISETWKLSGTIRVALLDPLATFVLDLTAASEQGTKVLQGALTVVRDGAGKFEGLLWDASPLVQAPCKALTVSGAFDTTRGTLALRFAPGPCKASDAFSAKGDLAATYTPKRASK